MVCQFLKEHREMKGLSQKALSDETGIPQSTLSSWEKGTNRPNVIDCIKLADFYGITIDELVGRDWKDF